MRSKQNVFLAVAVAVGLSTGVGCDDDPDPGAFSAPDVTIDEDQSTVVPVVVPAGVTVTGVASSDPSVVDAASVAITGTAPSYNLEIVPVADASGTVELDLFELDTVLGTVSVEVRPVNDAPVIGAIDDQVFAGFGELAVTVTVTDVDSPLSDVALSVAASDESVLRDDDIRIEAVDDGVFQLGLAPQTSANGPITVSVTADDGSDASTTSFAVEVRDECPAPTAPFSSASLCGRVVDIGSLEPLGSGRGCQPCDEASGDGVCAVEIQAYDPLQFAANPGKTPPLEVGDVLLDTCGRYRLLDVPVPFSGFVAVATSGTGYRLSATTYPMDVGEARLGVAAYATTTAVDAQWTASAGQPFGGDTFADTGVLVALYRYGNQPASGVSLTANEATVPDSTYYFSDDGDALTTVDPLLNATGANGAALLVNSPLRAHSGVGGEPAGCEWTSTIAASVAGAVSVTELPAHVLDDPSTRCER